MSAGRVTDVGPRQRYGAVLTAILAVFAIQGIATAGKWEQMLVSVLLGAALLIALWETRARSSVLTAATVIVVVVVLNSVLEAAAGDVDGAGTRLPEALLVALTPPAIVIGVGREIRARREVTLQTVFGVLSVYILIGMFFANIYVSVDRLGGSPFFAGGQPANIANSIYFSFTSLTTVGYGDFTARTSLGHTLSNAEGLMGQIYLVTVVALIVSHLGPHIVSRRAASQSPRASSSA